MNNKLKSSQQVKNLRFLANLGLGGLIILAVIMILPQESKESVKPKQPVKVWVKKKPLLKKHHQEVLDVNYSIEKLKLKDQLLEIHNSSSSGIMKKKSMKLLEEKGEILQAMEDVQLKINLHQSDTKFNSRNFREKMRELDHQFQQFESENPTVIIKE